MLIRQWMGLVGRFACYTAVSLLAIPCIPLPPLASPFRPLQPPPPLLMFPNCEWGTLDYDEAGFMLQLWHKGICEAWLGSTMSPTTRLYLRILACDELDGDLNFCGHATPRCIRDTSNYRCSRFVADLFFLGESFRTKRRSISRHLTIEGRFARIV